MSGKKCDICGGTERLKEASGGSLCFDCVSIACSSLTSEMWDSTDYDWRPIH